MKMAWPTSAVVFVAAVFVAVGCDSSQPARTQGTTASLTMTADATSLLFDCYDVWQDNDGDNNPEVDTGFKICEESTQVAQRPVPWHYALSISVIRAGTLTEEIVVSTDGLIGSSVLPGDNLDDYVSVTENDPRIDMVPFADLKLPADGIFFLNPKRVSRGSPVYLSINGFLVEPPNILTAWPSFDFAVNKGDTIIVRARKQPLVNAQPFLPQDPDPDLTIAAVLTVGGVVVTPAGTTASSDADGASFTFSYTVP